MRFRKIAIGESCSGHALAGIKCTCDLSAPEQREPGEIVAAEVQAGAFKPDPNEIADVLDRIRARLVDDDDSEADVVLLADIYNAVTGEQVPVPVED